MPASSAVFGGGRAAGPALVVGRKDSDRVRIVRRGERARAKNAPPKGGDGITTKGARSDGGSELVARGNKRLTPRRPP